MAAAESEAIDYTLERVAVKALCAVDLLKDAISAGHKLNKLKTRVDRYVRQAKLILTWKRGSGMVKMIGSGAKIVGGVMVVAAPLHPKLGMAVNAGHRLWKLGSGLKALNAIANMLRQMWQDGCRSALMDFTQSAAVFSTKVGIFQEVLRDLQLSSQECEGVSSAQCLVTAVQEFIPRAQTPWVRHIIHMVFGHQQYSPLFDFMALSSDPASESTILQTMREIESFHFTEFLQHSDSKALVSIVSFLHVTRELIDFLDGFNRLTDKDCRFLQECLSTFTQESVTIMKASVLLNNLYKMKTDLASEGGTLKASSQPISSPDVVEEKNLSCEMETESSHHEEHLPDYAEVDQQPVNSHNPPDRFDQCVDATVERSLLINNSRNYLSRVYSTLPSLSTVVSHGTSLIRLRGRSKEGRPGVADGADQFSDISCANNNVL